MRDGAVMWSSLPKKGLESLELIMTLPKSFHAWRTEFTDLLQRTLIPPMRFFTGLSYMA